MPNVLPLKYDTPFTNEFLKALEELRRLQDPIPSKSALIRELVMEALSGRRRRANGRRTREPRCHPRPPARPKGMSGRLGRRQPRFIPNVQRTNAGCQNHGNARVLALLRDRPRPQVGEGLWQS